MLTDSPKLMAEIQNNCNIPIATGERFTSIYEFLLGERVMTVFELSSGCPMHRSKESQKCKFLPLSKFR